MDEAIVGRGQRWRHRVRGSEYVVLAVGMMQDADPDIDYRRVVVYRGDDGMVWVRSLAEFTDGRFVEVARG